MRKYDFESMGSIWKNEARIITDRGVFVAGSGCGVSVWCSVSNLRQHLYRLRQIFGYSALVPDYWQSVNYDFLDGLGIA